MKKSDSSKLRQDLKYRNYKDILTIEDMRFRAKVNALAVNKTIHDASAQLEVSPKHLSDFMKANNITNEELNLMREHYDAISKNYINRQSKA